MQQGGKLSLTLLGPFELRKEPAQPIRLPKKAQGLLAFLAIGRGVSFSRDTLATLLWGNSATEQARQSLRQGLAALRDALGEGHANVLSANSTDISMSRSDSIVLDIETFEALSQSAEIDDLQRATELYRGDFLSGLQIAVEPFERWLTIERQRLFAKRLDLQHRLALARASGGSTDEAIGTARGLVDLDPLSEPGHRLLMQLLARGGQRAAALKQYDQCKGILREELDVAPEAETTRLAELIRSGDFARDEGGVASIPAAPGLSAGDTDSRGSIAGAGRAAADKPSIVVLPFANLSSDLSQDYLVQGLVDDITVALGREGWLFVIDGSSAQTLKDRSLDAREVGRKLGVQYVLKGSVRIDGGDVIFVVQLSDSVRGVHVWSERFHDKLDNVFALQQRLTTRAAGMIAPALKSFEIDRALHKPTTNLTAFDLYLRALPKFRSSRADNQTALKLLEEAVSLDPGYAAAYALAARCYQFQLLFNWCAPDHPGLQEGTRLAHRAIEIGKNDSEALWMAGLTLVHTSDELDLGLAQIERSLSLNPNSANAWTASCFTRSYLGDTAIAIDSFNQAQRLNPLDLSQHLHWNALAWAYLGGGRVEEAHDAAARTLSVDPSYPPGLRMKISTCGLLGRVAQAQESIGRLKDSKHGATISWIKTANRFTLRRNPRALELFVQGARMAGLPEE